MLRCIYGNRPKYWDLALHQVEFAMNIMSNRSVGKTPFDIVYVNNPNFTTNISFLEVFKSKQAFKTIGDIVKMLVDVKDHLNASNSLYKLQANK